MWKEKGGLHHNFEFTAVSGWFKHTRRLSVLSACPLPGLESVREQEERRSLLSVLPVQFPPLSLPLPLSLPPSLNLSTPFLPFIMSHLKLYLSGSLSISALPFSPLLFLSSLSSSLLLTSSLPPFNGASLHSPPHPSLFIHSI